MVNTTNVKSAQLNYNKYSLDKYDRDIVNSIPYHEEIHKYIKKLILKVFDSDKKYQILDFGVGTGITSKIIKELLPNSIFDVVDFSRQMLNHAKKRLGKKNVNYIFGDYSKINLTKQYDIIISVIGIHHQNKIGKKQLFKKIFNHLKPNGIFIFGDLVTYKDLKTAALNNALHYNHMVKNATDNKTLKDWAYHHMYLNDLASIEDQIKWLEDIGFKVKKKFLKINTALLFCKK